MNNVKKRRQFTILLIVITAIAICTLLFAWASSVSEVVFNTSSMSTSTVVTHASSTSFLATGTTFQVAEIPVAHLATPVPLYAAYMTSCIASGKKLRSHMLKLLETTELNAVVIDIKDFSGKLSIDTGLPVRGTQSGDPHFMLNTNGCAIPDIKEFLTELHEKHIYVIGRVTVMQDNTYPKSHPDAAVQSRSTGGVWHDKKGISFIDPGATEYWQYMVDLGKAAHALGFDEIIGIYRSHAEDVR